MEPVTPSSKPSDDGPGTDRDDDDPTKLTQVPVGATMDGTPLPEDGDAAPLFPGALIGDYRIERKLGAGGMGVVFAAVHPLIGKRAAIKVLKKELCSDRYNIERFVDEARVVNQIGHPNIVDVFAFGTLGDGRSYLVMEWLDGQTLREAIARGPMTVDEVSAIIRPLTRALEAAHAKGVIHRDLKPDNIFLVNVPGELPRVKLLDFGIAKLANAEHRVERTATGAMVGTPQYIAPEQAKGHAIDHRVDIYSLGAIVFEMLTNQPPFVADNAMEMVAKHLMEAPPAPSSFVRVPRDLDQLVVRMLAKAPDERPSLSELYNVLGRAYTLDEDFTLREDERASAPRAATPPPLVPTPDPPRPIAAPRPGTPAPVRPGTPAPVRPGTPAPVTETLLPPTVSRAVPRSTDEGWAHEPHSGPHTTVDPAVPVTRTEETPEPALLRGRGGHVAIAVLALVASSVAAYVVVRAVRTGDEPPVVAALADDASGVAAEPDAATRGELDAGIVVEPAPVVVDAAVPAVAPDKGFGERTPPVTRPNLNRPPVRPPPARLVLRIEGATQGIEVFVDGKRVTAHAGTNNLTFPRGKHLVEVRAPDKRTEHLTVDLGASPTTRSVTLVPTPKGLMDPGSLPPKVRR